MKWFAIQAKVRQEQIAVENLERQGFNVFLPMVRNAKYFKGRWYSPLEVLFPGYLFIQLDLQSQDVSSIRSTRGVVGLVRLGGNLISVPDGLITALRSRHECGSIDYAKLFERGDVVSFNKGPFKGLNGIFEARSSVERVVVLLNLLGSENRVNASMHQITPQKVWHRYL